MADEKSVQYEMTRCVGGLLYCRVFFGCAEFLGTGLCNYLLKVEFSRILSKKKCNFAERETYKGWANVH